MNNLKNNLLLDITTVITLVSDLCLDPNIANRFGDIKEWQIRNKLVYEQIIDEMENPVYHKLMTKIKNKKLCITESTLDKIKEIIDNLGSNDEKLNLKKFLKNTLIIEDDPHEIFKNFQGKNWNSFNKNIFGTAYKHDMIIVTGNINILNALINEFKLDVKYIAHRSRCFIGKKYEK